MDKIRVIQIGTGLQGLYWINSIMAMEDKVEIVAIVDMSLENLERAKELLDGRAVPAFTDYKQALQETEADIALVVTPPGTHKMLMKETLKAGLHVILEKPISLDWNESLEMAAVAEQSDRYVMVSQNYRWNPAVLAVKNAVEANVVGPSNGSVSAILRFESNVQVHYYSSFVNRGSDTPWTGNFRLIGRDGAIEVYNDSPYIVKLDGTREDIPLPKMEYTGLKYSLFHMMESIREGRKPLTHIGDNLRSWEVVCRAEESIKERRMIRLLS